MHRTVRSFVLGLATGVGIIAAAFLASELPAQLTKWENPTPAPVLFCYNPPQEEELPFQHLLPPRLTDQIPPIHVCYEQPLVENREYELYE